MRNSMILILAVVALAGCQSETATTNSASSATQQSGVNDPHAGTDPSQVGTMEMMGNAGALAEADITYDLPAGWVREQPSSSMRLDQAVIPGAGGDGHLAVFFFGPGGGGGTQANLDRWAGQLQQTAEPSRESFEANGFTISMIEVEGTLLPSGMGSGPTEPQPDSLLYGAVVEGAGGPWFFKATGARATLGEQKEAFVGMLRSVRASL